VGWEPCLVDEQPGEGRLTGSLRGRGSFEERVQRRKRRSLHPWELTWRSSTARGRRVESDSDIWEERPDFELILDCFQQGLTEVANAEHVERTTVGGGKYMEQGLLKRPHRRPSVPAIKIASAYERVLRSLERDGIFVKLSKIPGGGVGPS